MASKVRLASLLLGLALSPASCLPRPDQHQETRSVHSARAAPLKMPGWEIAVVIFGLVVGLILFGVIGGACETLICMHFKRPVRPDPGTNPDGLDFGCQGARGGMPEIKIIEEKDAADKVSVFYVEKSLGRSGSNSSGVSSNSGISNSSGGSSSRYSWQDEKGITTEMYLDGSLPDAGPGMTAHDTVSNIQYEGYQVQGAMRGYQGVHYQGPQTGLASNPPFVLHNEEDESDYEYEHEGSSSSQDSKTYPRFAVATSTEDIVSPLTPEAQNAAWPKQPVSAGQAARYFSDVDLEERSGHSNNHHYDN